MLAMQAMAHMTFPSVDQILTRWSNEPVASLCTHVCVHERTYIVQLFIDTYSQTCHTCMPLDVTNSSSKRSTQQYMYVRTQTDHMYM